MWILDSIKNKLKGSNLSEDCNFYIDRLEKKILDKFDKNILIGFQSKVDNLYLQERGFRYYNKSNAYIDISDTNNNFSYKFKAIKSSQEIYLDESFVSYKNKNTIYKVGRIKRWWSPSDFTSLIYSLNQTHPNHFN